MFANSKITVISAHPDDWEIGMGQFLLDLLKPERNNRIQICVVTEGGAGGDSVSRRLEQRRVMMFLEARFPITFLGIHSESYAFLDTELESTRELISYLERVCAGSDVVFTHYPDDSHQDHRALGQSIRPACRYIANVLFYQSYTALNFQPSLFYEFSRAEMESPEGKLKLITFHHSQVERYRGSSQDLVEDMHALAAYNGFLFKTPRRCAEGFVPWRLSMREKFL
jgi:LmbE family N-acetylglucosaminyl deacetylase